MATVIVNHRVNNYSSWRKIYDADVARRDAAGMKQLAVGESSDDPGNVYIIWEVGDVAAFNKMLGDPDLQKTMQEAGVISAPQAIILK